MTVPDMASVLRIGLSVFGSPPIEKVIVPPTVGPVGGGGGGGTSGAFGVQPIRAVAVKATITSVNSSFFKFSPPSSYCTAELQYNAIPIYIRQLDAYFLLI